MTVDPQMLGGGPCIREMCFPVSRMLRVQAAKERGAASLRQQPDFELAEIRKALVFATNLTG